MKGGIFETLAKKLIPVETPERYLTMLTVIYAPPSPSPPLTQPPAMAARENNGGYSSFGKFWKKVSHF